MYKVLAALRSTSLLDTGQSQFSRHETVSRAQRRNSISQSEKNHACLDIVDWIEGYYNRQRLHTSIDFLTRVGYEASLIVA
ncbi:hypothetical protein [Burkholderia cepacia]|uniref:hypothetical protein n=1 Tax=Burkholderia cepacia TaxID=292 RepID=UPI0009BFC8AA|nr:hypothetical protein [Burkholderia cepacia]